jgi:Ca2+-binding EF-hand superfamily protein
MVKSMDRNRSESIEYIEFIIAAIDRKELVGNEDNLRGIFRDMDKSGRGFITLNEIK